jgi:hypothetical protein
MKKIDSSRGRGLKGMYERIQHHAQDLKPLVDLIVPFLTEHKAVKTTWKPHEVSCHLKTRYNDTYRLGGYKDENGKYVGVILHLLTIKSRKPKWVYIGHASSVGKVPALLLILKSVLSRDPSSPSTEDE